MKFVKRLLVALIVFSLILSSLTVASALEIHTEEISYMTVQDLPLALARSLTEVSLDAQVISRNSLYEIETRLADGTGYIESFALPVKYVDETGQQRYIDTAMQQLGVLNRLFGQYDYRNAAGSFDVRYSEDVTVGVSFDNAFTTTVLSPSSTAEEGYVTTDAQGNGKMIYPDVFGEYTYLEYINGTNGIKENIILYQNIGRNTFSFVLRTEGLVAELLNGGEAVQLREPNQQQAAYIISPLYVYDAYIPLGEPNSQSTFSHHTMNCHYQLEQLGTNEYLLTYVIDQEWLNSPEIVWPVTIDPSISTSVANSNITDTYVVEGNPSALYHGYNIMNIGERSGENYGTLYGYVKFGTLPTLPDNTTITSVDFEMKTRGSQDTGDRGACYRVTSSKSINSICWNNQPSYDTTALSYCHAKSVPLPNNTAYICTGYTFDITRAYNLWIENPSSNYGLRIAYADPEVADFSTFYSSEATTATNAPKLTVKYLSSDAVQGFVAGKVYSLYNAKGTTPLYLNANSNNSSVLLKAASGAASQQWQIMMYADNWCELIPQSDTTKRLYVNQTLSGTNDFTTLLGGTASTQTTEEVSWRRFKLIEVEQGKFILRSKADSRRVLAVDSGNVMANATIEAENYDEANALTKGQVWALQEVGETAGITSQTVYFLNNKGYGDYTLEYSDLGIDMSLSYERANEWRLVYAGEGYYYIESMFAFKNAQENRYLAYNFMNVRLTLSEAESSQYQQKWRVLLNDDGSYRILNRYNNAALAMNELDEVQLLVWDGTNKQKWKLQEILFDRDLVYYIENDEGVLSVPSDFLFQDTQLKVNTPADPVYKNSYELWRFEPCDENLFYIYPLHHSEKSLSFTTSQVMQEDITNKKQWYFDKLANGRFYIQREVSNGSYMSTSGTTDKLVGFGGMFNQWTVQEYTDTIYWSGGYSGIADLSDVYYTIEPDALDVSRDITVETYRQAVESWNGISSNVHLQYVSYDSVANHQFNGKPVIFSITTEIPTGEVDWYGACTANGMSPNASDDAFAAIAHQDWQYATIYLDIEAIIQTPNLLSAVVQHEVGHALKLSHPLSMGFNVQRQTYVSIMQNHSELVEDDTTNDNDGLQIKSNTITQIDKMALQAKWGK